MRVKILNRLWNLRFAPNMADYGDCDTPDKRGKEIRIASWTRGEERLETLIHEMIHAVGWHIDEEFTDEFARDVAHMLWRLGYQERTSC